MANAALDPHASLRQAVRGNRVLGVLMIAICVALFVSAALNFHRFLMEVEALVTSASLFLLAPGILYQLAALAMKKQEQRAGRMSMYLAIGQSIPSLLVLCFLMLRPRVAATSRLIDCLLMPLLLVVFFVPALLAQAWKLSRAIKAIRLLPSTERAFEVIAVQPNTVVPPSATGAT